MANIEELLQKQKNRIEKMETPVTSSFTSRKKITRTGATRPWQENLSQYQTQPATQDQDFAPPTLNAATHYTSPETIDKESSIKENRTQTEHKVDTNRAQTVHKVDTNRTQVISAKSQKFSETGHKPDTQPDTKGNTNRTQTAHKPDTKYTFSALIGLQREVTIFAYNSCKITRTRVTEPLTLEHIATSLQIRIGSVKTTIRRLEEKDILCRIDFKNGRGGWSRYELLDEIYREIMQLETGHKLNTNRTQTAHKVDTQPDTQPDTSSSSSSSILEIENLKTTTSDQLLKSDKFELGPDWLSVDFSSLAEIGFTETHLTQVASRGKLTPELLQSSINAFAFDLNKNQKGKSISGSALNFFMGIVGKGSVYAPPANYETPEDEALRKLVEAKAKQVAKRAALLQQLKDIEFDEWYKNLSETEKVERAPLFQKEGDARRASIRSQWELEIWPEISQNIPGFPKQSREEVSRLIDQSLGKVME